MKKHLTTVILLLAFAVGLCLLLYPSVSDYWNSLHQSRVITNYAEAVASLEDDGYDELIEAAREWNDALRESGGGLSLPEEKIEEYSSTLDAFGTGMMGYIEIPAINCSLPIYHGTDDNVLQVAVGHIEGSSLPVGGEGTHCVLSGHRGLPSARLFTDLDKLTVGDTFLLRVLDETLTYEVDRILIVLPHEVSSLAIEDGKDYCTLVTCTPYGVNTHRLLVRGHRIENAEEAKLVRVTADAMRIEPSIVAPLVSIPILLLLLLWVMVSTGRKKKR